MTAPKTGTALAIISAETDVIAHRAQMAAEKAEKYALSHRRRSEHADRIADWASHRKEAMRATFFMVADLVQAIRPFVPYGGGDEDFDITVKAADVKRLREALARIGEVP